MKVQIVKSNNKIEVTNGNGIYKASDMAYVLSQSEKIKALNDGVYILSISVIVKDGISLFKILEIE